MNISGPSDETLRRLAGMLPSFVEGQVKKKTVGHGTNILPRRICNVCGRGYDIGPMAREAIPYSAPCATCQERLNAGEIAFLCKGEFAFVKCAELPDMAGKVIPLGEVAFRRIQAKFANAPSGSN